VGRGGPGVLTDPEELRALLLLRLLPGVGDRRVADLLSEHGSACAALSAPATAFARVGGRRGAAARTDPELLRRVDDALERCRMSGIRIVPIGDPLYPECLRHLADPPPVLFLRGDPVLLRIPSVTIVGSRRSTAAGRRTARRLAGSISARGVPVVSGLALGIDAAAHRGALEGPGGTVAVMGCGVDRAHPPGNRRLLLRILEEGLLVSEFFPGEPARPHHFPRRNRILAALSDSVVVVEAAARSGALITVDHALDLGREVFAVPGSVEAPQSRGTNRMLGDGAGAVTSIRELEPALRWGWRKWAADPAPMDRRGSREHPERKPSKTKRKKGTEPERGARDGGGDAPAGACVPGSGAILPLLGSSPRSLERLV
jgi:DNA processing protein